MNVNNAKLQNNILLFIAKKSKLQLTFLIFPLYLEFVI